ncbi:MAG: RNA methyltransferase [Leptolinea sp.]
MITSSANPRVKEIRKLRDRKRRTETGLAWVEGLRACGDAFTRLDLIREVVYCPETLQSDFADELLKKAEIYKLDILPVSRDAFLGLSGKDNPQGIGVVIQQQIKTIEDVKPETGDLWVVLDRIADPGNLGTILRTLDAIGGKGLILLDQCTDPYDPTAIRASTGALFHLDLVKTDSAGFTAWKKNSAVQLVAVVAVAGVLDYHTYAYGDPLLIMLGSEREGLQSALLDLCDAAVCIPMVGHVDSLNLAEATAITLFEVFNQRREEKMKDGAIQ